MRADEVTLLDLLEAIEQNLPLFRTDSQPRAQGETPTLRHAAHKGALADAEDALRSNLREVTVTDISKWSEGSRNLAAVFFHPNAINPCSSWQLG